METTIKPNFQISIPFELIKELNLSVNDKVELKTIAGEIIISKKKNKKKSGLLKLRGIIKVGQGNIEKDIEKMKKIRAKEIADTLNE